MRTYVYQPITGQNPAEAKSSKTNGVLLGFSELFTKSYAGIEYSEVAKCSEEFILTLKGAGTLQCPGTLH